jgi:hypothetical protein
LQILEVVAVIGGLLLVVAYTEDCCLYRELLLIQGVIADAGGYCCHWGLLQMQGVIAVIGCYCRCRGLFIDAEDCEQ